MSLLKNHMFLNKYPFLILLLFLLVAYFPVFLPFFHLKNDIISQNLPTRFFISESIYSKTFPWWNPYFNYGIPQYGDMNNGYWNPFLWIIARLFGYNILTITLEEMFYILIGGWGIYKITQYYKIPQHISIICSLSYMSGGYIIGHLQHFCWITGTAFFPYVLYFFLRSLNQPILKNFIAGGIFSFLFVASTHPGLIIGALYFFFFLIAHIIFITSKNKEPEKLKIIIKASFLFCLFSAIFSIIVIASNLEVLQYITRGSKVSVPETLSHPTTFQSYLSLFFPLAVNKGNFFHTDISMRNMSIGISLLPGTYFAIKNISFKKNWILLLMLIFFILLAAGGYFKLFSYYFLPYLGYVRLNGEFAYFPYLILIVASAYGLAKITAIKTNQIQKVFGKMLFFFIAALLISMFYILITKDSILFATSVTSLTNAKQIVNSLTFGDLLFLSCLLQSITIFLLKKYPINSTSFLVVSLINLVFISWFCLPYTGLGQKPRKEIQAIIGIMPKGINKPAQKTINANSYIDNKYDTIIGSSAFYSKQIGYPTPLPYPVILRQTDLFYSHNSLVQFINAQSFLFLSKDTTIDSQTTYDSSLIKILNYTPTETKAQVQNNGFTYLTFLQNNYPRWKVFLDGKPIQHFTVFKTFIGIAIPPGDHEVEFKFNTTSLQIILWANIFILAIALFLLTQKKIINKSFFSNNSYLSSNEN